MPRKKKQPEKLKRRHRRTKPLPVAGMLASVSEIGAPLISPIHQIQVFCGESSYSVIFSGLTQNQLVGVLDQLVGHMRVPKLPEATLQVRNIRTGQVRRSARTWKEAGRRARAAVPK